MLIVSFAPYIPPDAHKGFEEFLKAAVPVISAIVPAAIAAFIKWAQDHDQQRRKADLIERIAKLAKNISDLPPASESGTGATDRFRAALDLEMESLLRELTLLQSHVSRRVIGVSSIASGLRSALLLYRPKGFAAWTLHLAFYLSLLLLAFMSLGFFASTSDHTTAPTSPGVVIFIYIMLGVPPLILRFYAARIHRRQCANLQAATGPATVSPLTT
jgi:hypothetical protein